MNKILIVFIMLGITACAGKQNLHITDPKVAEESITCTHDDFAKQTTCKAIVLSSPEKNSIWDNSSSLSLGFFAILPDKGNTTIGMQGGIVGYNWHFPKTILDNNGQEFKIQNMGTEIPICLQTAGCLKIEKIAIELSKDYIKKHAKEGFSMKVYGENSSVIVSIPAPYVEGFYNFIRNKELNK